MELLSEKNYHKVTSLLMEVKINNLFARSVVEKKVKGKVFVNDPENPETCYVIHPYFMSLLFGDSTNIEFNMQLLDHLLNKNKVRDQFEWMQAYPGDWNHVLNELYGDQLIHSVDNRENLEKGIIELNTRINFKFNHHTFLANRRTTLPSGCEIVRADQEIFEKMQGSVIPRYFWNSADDFRKNSIGFSLVTNSKLASTAYAAFIHDDQLELGIETVPEQRGKGYAHLACSALIDYCLGHEYEPVWACRLENTGSYKLALKLGFEEEKRIPYYRLSK